MTLLLVSVFIATLCYIVHGQDRQLDSDLPPCQGKLEDAFYNVEIKLIDVDTCDDNDLYAIGELIQQIIVDVESTMPEYKREFLETELCAAPVTTAARRMLRLPVGQLHRRLGLYSYRGGGYCRRCRIDNYDRRLKDYKSSMDRQLHEKRKLNEEERKEIEKLRKDLEEDLDDVDDKIESIVKKLKKQGDQREEIIKEIRHINELLARDSDSSDGRRQKKKKEFEKDLEEIDEKIEKLKKRLKKKSDERREIIQDIGTSEKLLLAMDTEALPTADPTASPTASPTAAPTQAPTMLPTAVPTESPTQAPTTAPTPAPTHAPTSAPTPAPTTPPTRTPTDSPTATPTASPTASPSQSPTMSPTAAPTESPTQAPTRPPTSAPTHAPTSAPTASPTDSPTDAPTVSPTVSPTAGPSPGPSKAPTAGPTKSPSASPTAQPTTKPTSSPTSAPVLFTSPREPESTLLPSSSPSKTPTRRPTASPTVSPTAGPSSSPTHKPTFSPTKTPSASPTVRPTASPTTTPTVEPTPTPTKSPSASPTKSPTDQPTWSPTPSPTVSPTKSPTGVPTGLPTKLPTAAPTKFPTSSPTKSPTSTPTAWPTSSPTALPTFSPTESPTTFPTVSPSFVPTSFPSISPSDSPTGIEELLQTSDLPKEEKKSILDVAKGEMALTALEILEGKDLTSPLPATGRSAPLVASRSAPLVAARSAPIPGDETQTQPWLARIEAAEHELEAYQELNEQVTKTVEEAAALLKYVLKARSGQLVGQANWDPAAETENSMEQWLRTFGDRLVPAIRDGLVERYNSTAGGCIDVRPDVDVIVTQLESFVGQYSIDDCPAPTHSPTQLPTQMPTGSPGGTAIWAQGSQSIAEYSDFDGSTFGAPNPGPDTSYAWSFMEGATSPTRDEKIVVGTTDEDPISRVTVIRWNGNNWSRESIPGIGNVLGTASTEFWNNANVAYESQGGNALLVWDDNRQPSNSMLRYSVWNGSSWTPAASILGIIDEPRYFDIASNPLLDEIVVVVTCDKPTKRIYVLVWNGSTWSNGPLQISIGQRQAGVAVAFESKDGEGMVVYGKTTAYPDIFYQTWDGSKWSGEKSLRSPAGDASLKRAVLSSDHNSNRLVLGVIDGNRDTWLSVWDGSKWEASATITATTGIGSYVNYVLSVAFEGLSGRAMAAYREGNAIKYRILTGTSWSGEQTVPGYSSMPTVITIDADKNSNKIMLLVQSDGSALHGMLWDGDSDSWGSVEQLETNTGKIKDKPLVFLWN